jgi:S1-C subfamily serine protease
VQFPDTLIDYDNSSDQGYIKSVAIKFNQRNLLFGDSSLVPFEIKSVDENYDLALIQINNNEEYSEEFPPLSIRMGDSKDLKWGSMLYIIGYPKGAAVVTRGIVSSPNRTPRGDFLTDALFNHGMSGGIILASNNNYLTFEWVGIANTASAEQENILVPDPKRRTSEQLTEPYKGTIFVEKKTRIVYGLTQSIPTAGITGFLGQNKELLRDTDNELPNF